MEKQPAGAETIDDKKYFSPRSHLHRNIKTLTENLSDLELRWNRGELTKEEYDVMRADGTNAIKERQEELRKLRRSRND